MTAARTRIAAVLRRADRWSVAGAVLAVVPFVTAVIRAIRTAWFPVGDAALLYIRAADIFTRHHPWLGSWTSASQSVGHDMNNPGAMYDWLMAPAARILPPGPGAAVGVAMINVACIVGIALASRSVGGRSFERWMVLAAAALSWSMGSELLIDIWQAHALMLPFLLLLVLLTGESIGRRSCLPWAVAVGSLLIQTHISYVFVVALLVATTAVLRWRRPRTEWRAAAVVGIVLWLPTIGEQLFGAGEGNLSRLARGVGGGSLVLGLHNAVGAVAAVLTRPWWWLRPGFSSTIPSTAVSVTDGRRTITLTGVPSLWLGLTALLALTVALAALARVHRRRGAADVAAACVLAAVLPLGAVACLDRLTVGPAGLAAHHVRWLWAAGAFVHAVLGWSIVRLVAPVMRATVADGAAVALTAACALWAIPMVAHPEGPTADRAATAVLGEVVGRLDILAGHGPIRFETDNLRVYEPFSSAVMMALQERGIEFRVANEGMVRQLGESRRASGTETVVLMQLEGIDAVNYSGDECRIALATATTDAEDARARESGRELEEALAAGVIVAGDPAAVSDEDSDLIERALAGEPTAIESLIYRGVLRRALDAGALRSSDPTAIAAAQLVDRWVAGAYALVASLPPDSCPA